MGLFNLSNLAENAFGGFAKALGSLVILFIIIAVIYWIKSMQNKGSTNIVVMRRPN